MNIFLIFSLVSFAIYAVEEQVVYLEDTMCSRKDLVGDFTAYTLEENIKVYEIQDIKSKVIDVISLPIYSKTKHSRVSLSVLKSCHDQVKYKKGKNYNLHMVDMFTYGFSQIVLDDNRKGYVDKDKFFFVDENNKKFITQYVKGLKRAKGEKNKLSLYKNMCEMLDYKKNEFGLNRLHELGQLDTKILSNEYLQPELFRELKYSYTLFTSNKLSRKLSKAIYGENHDMPRDKILDYCKLNSFTAFSKLYAFNTVFRYIFEDDPAKFIKKLNKEECKKIESNSKKSPSKS